VVFSDKELEPFADVLGQIPSTAPESKKRITLGDGHEKICNVYGVITRVSETSAEMITRAVDFTSDYPIYKKADDGKIAFLPGLKLDTAKAQTLVEGLLGLMSDCFRLIPANRYLLSESMPSGKVSEAALNPRTFKQWLFAASLARDDFHKFEEIQKLFNTEPFAFGELSFSQDGSELEIMVKKNGFRLPINRMGSGLQQILYLIAVIVLNRHKVLAIEELEINLAPTAQKQVFNLLKQCVTESFLNQIFVTSHSDYFEVRGDAKRFSVTYDHGNACTNVAPLTKAWRKEHFFHEKVLDLEKETDIR